MRLFEQGGVPLSDSESDGMRGSVNIADIEHNIKPQKHSTHKQ